ncbi:MAG: glycosyltransferase family 39 protein [Kiritimatiellia bacterium]
MSDATETTKRGDWADRLAAALLLLGVAVRVAGAWAARGIGDPDSTVVALMARHMAALKEFPVFFYGQAYMGSLEPMASALMVGLLGSNGFAVNLGPALFASAALFLLWRWARDAAGPRGGLAAVLAGLFGPLVYFQFQAAPRGGYMVALFVDALAIFAAARMAARLRGGHAVGGGRYFALGLLAGIGAWSNMIVAPALGAAALLLLHGMRGKFWRHPAGIASGLAGFALGFAPWLAWNARHGWASLAMSQIGGHAPLREALSNSWNRFLLLQQGRNAAGSGLPLVLAAVVLGLAGAGVFRAMASRRRASLPENYARSGAILFCALFALVFATSGFTRTHTARYWVPLVPALAVLAGVACAASGSRAFRAAAWGLLVALAAGQGALALSSLAASGHKSAATLAGYRDIGEALARAGADALLAPIQLFPLNFALDERFAVSNGRQKFYEPILRRAELSDAPAYSSDFNGVGSFLVQQGAQWESIAVGRRSLLYNVRRPPVSLREIPAENTESLRDGAGRDWRSALMDRNLDTFWSPGAAPAVPLEWTFVQPQDVHSIQLAFAHSIVEDPFAFSFRIRVEVQIGGEWRTLLADEPVNPLEGSGPRLYFSSGLARPEFRLEAAGAQALRITLLDAQASGRSLGWRLAEVVALDSSEGLLRRHTSAAVEALGKWLLKRAPETAVYAPRWISNQLLAGRWVPEERLAGLAARVFPPGNVARDGSVAAERPGVFIVEPRYEDAMRHALGAHGAEFQFDTVNKWCVFSVNAGGWTADGLGLPPAVRWTGETLLLGNSSARAAEAIRRLCAGKETGKTQPALLEEVVRWRPAALAALPEETVARLGGARAVQVRRESADLPEKPCATEFANGIWLEGVETGPVDAKAGGEIEVRLHWSAAAGFEPGQEITFIHVRDSRGALVAQDDYRGLFLLWGDASLRPVAREGLAETRRLSIPAGTPPGPLDLAVGLYQSQSGFRVPIRRSDAPAIQRRAALWPGRWTVVP